MLLQKRISLTIIITISFSIHAINNTDGWTFQGGLGGFMGSRLYGTCFYCYNLLTYLQIMLLRVQQHAHVMNTNAFSLFHND